ncbi:DNA helicase [Vibrio cholerae]|uniref:replicative DNA helicase n=1 Tax=Vibrio cholerae TaxID=666 RepID=UPI0011D91A8F|nr:DnaB-like helicase C-terminal domain-containing protein [Vibrio cholerae]TXY57638.1 AAA family ATPase [Vibrio cholerae]GHX89549.1 DNA helicase [Vibrio cholerae]
MMNYPVSDNAFSAEQSVIGSLVLIGDMTQESAMKLLGYLKESSFSYRAHQVIFKTIRDMAHRGEYVDMISLESSLNRSGYLEDCGGFAYLADICKNTPSAANAMAYADMVRENAIERVIASKYQNALALLSEKDGRKASDKLGDMISELESISARSSRGKESGLVHISEVSEQWVNELDQRFSNPELAAGYTTGIESLDKILYPKFIRRGSLVVIGARPKMGKTNLLNNFVSQFAFKHKKSCAVFSLEMPNGQVFERMVSSRAQIKSEVFYCGSSDDADFAKMSIAVGELNQTNIYLDDTPGIDLKHIQREARKLAKKSSLGLIAVDYLTLMRAEKADRNDLAYGEITKGLKNLAKELDCVVLLLTQLNRNLESRGDKRPMPSDSRDTGQIEQDCDLWLGVYRESVYRDNVAPEARGITEVIARLNRHGGTGTAYLNLVNGYFTQAEPHLVHLAYASGTKNKGSDY